MRNALQTLLAASLVTAPMAAAFAGKKLVRILGKSFEACLDPQLSFRANRQQVVT
ncbi:MAG TPA: hypothetical protein VGE69_02130 [Pseudomonadales bacterium]